MFSQRFAFLCLLLATWCGCSSGESGDRHGAQPVAAKPMIPVALADPEMSEAIAAARDKLPEFWTALDHPPAGTSRFAVQVAVTDDNITENFWLIDLEKRDGKINGAVNNHPKQVKSVRFAERLDVAPEKITDWMYLRDGKIVGNFTLRPLLKKMPIAEAAKLKKLLGEP